ncbi:MAG: helix-turn-helix domain-containing protein [Chloroflexi bacterium]|nr:helix-turn-helix domain-containing protein [Chloroflexota bacterium]
MAEEPGGGTDGPGAREEAVPLVRYSVPQAARILGISERAVRKRIDHGTLAAERDGLRWLVLLPGSQGGTPQPPGASLPERAPAGEPAFGDMTAIDAEVIDAIPVGRLHDPMPIPAPFGGMEVPMRGTDPEPRTLEPVPAVTDLAALLREERERNERLQRTVMELAGQVGYLQGQLEATRDQLKLLPPPAGPEPASGQTGSRGRGWRRFLGGRDRAVPATDTEGHSSAPGEQ